MARPRKWSPVLAILSVLALLGAAGGLVAAAFAQGQTEILMGVAAGAGLNAVFFLILFIVRRFFTFFTTVSIGGLMLGTTALVIVLSVMAGFETDLQEKILGFNAHLLVTKVDGEFTEYHDIGKKVSEDPDVVAYTPYVTSEVVIAANNNYANVIIKGIDPQTVSRVTELEKNIKLRERPAGEERSEAERRDEQARAMRALWPLYDDGGVRDVPPDAGSFGFAPDAGTPADAGIGPDATDPAPPDFGNGDLVPPDLSGGMAPEDLPPPDAVDPDEDEPGAGDVVDPAPEDLDVDVLEVPDLSGGVTDPDELAEIQEADDEGDLDQPVGGDAGLPDLGDFAAPIGIDDLDTPPPPPQIPARVAVLPGVLVGQELVKQIHLFVGQQVRIVSPLGEMTPQGRTFYTRFYRVAGKFYTGMYEYDLKFIYVDMVSLQDFLNLGDQANGIEVRVRDPDDAGAVRARLMDKLGDGYRVQDWQELNRSLFSALKLEKIAMFLVLGIIIVVASFSIIGTLIMVVFEKSREIALLKTLGSSDGGVMFVFLSQGLIIGLVGTLSGVSLGLAASMLLQQFGFPLDPDVYYIDQLPIRIEWLSILQVTAAGILVSAAATIYPALMASRVRPADGLRYE
jgi:lipoprotein-releasing system permease protein